jgi:hypothetical protein
VTVQAPQLLFLNHSLAEGLRLGPDSEDEALLAAMSSGDALLEGAQPIAQAYAGHQFWQFSPQLGNGRALLIGEVIDDNTGDVTLRESVPDARGSHAMVVDGKFRSMNFPSTLCLVRFLYIRPAREFVYCRTGLAAAAIRHETVLCID